MDPMEMIVQRRWPTFDYAVQTSLPLAEVASRIEHFLTHQERPKGFVLTDPRVDGQISGSTFTLSRREAGLGGSVAPYAEGQLIPAPDGTNILIRVQIPTFWWVFDAFFLILVFTSFGLSFSWRALLVVVIMATLLLVVSLGPMWMEASQIARLLRRVLQPRHAD